MRNLLILIVCGFLLSACSLFRRSEKYGCPTNGKNVGAEKILSGDKDAIKTSRKASKFND